MADLTMMAGEQGVSQAPAGGGAAGGAGATANATGGQNYAVDPSNGVQDIQERAEPIAAQWIQMHAQQPNSHKSEMSRCENENPTLYAAAKDIMGKMRNQAGSQGRANVADMIGPPQ